MTGPKRRPEPLGDALSAYLEKSGLAERIEQARIIPEWAELVGPQIAAVTEPISIARDGTLFVAVNTNSWMQELSLMERQLLAAINAVPGRTQVLRLRFRIRG